MKKSPRTFLIRTAMVAGALMAIGVAWGAEGEASAAVAPGNREEILFLHLRWKTNTVSLVETTVVPGTLKPAAEATGGLVVQLQSEEGEVLHEGRIARPKLRLYEIGDPATSGAIEARVVTLPETEFTIRLPRKARARWVEFWEPSIEPARVGVGPKSLGRVRLPL